jgi:replication-associated recombination protein RarA
MTEPMQRAMMTRPYASNWLFVGPSGTGKTSFARAICNAVAGELHHIGSQECNVDTLERVRSRCQYVPMAEHAFHVVIVDEADQMSTAAQLKLLSFLDGTDQAPNTIWIFTCNDTARLQDRFLSRCKVLEFSSYGIAADVAQLLARIWDAEAAGSPAPNFARIVKESNNNVRESLNRIETELLAA